MRFSFFTLAKPAFGEYKDKGSRFLAYTFKFESETTLKAILQELKAEHFKAVHFCWAYRIDAATFRANDDGEPAGSAGKPILNVLQSNNLEQILVVVVRYFGGTLLGVPGLIKAYKEATALAIDNGEIVEIKRFEILRLGFNVESMNIVMKNIKTFDIKIISQNYNSLYLMDIQVYIEVLDQVKEELKSFIR
jgi:uncharacterized YigZ family protein